VFYNRTKCLTLLCILYVALVNFSFVLFLLYLHCCTDCIDNRPGVIAMCSLSVPQQLARAAFIYCIILPLCQLLRLNDDDDDDDDVLVSL